MSCQNKVASFPIIFILLIWSCQCAIMPCNVGNNYDVLGYGISHRGQSPQNCPSSTPNCATLAGKADAFNGMFLVEGDYSIGYCVNDLDCGSFSCNIPSATTKLKELEASTISSMIASFTKKTCSSTCVYPPTSTSATSTASTTTAPTTAATPVPLGPVPVVRATTSSTTTSTKSPTETVSSTVPITPTVTSQTTTATINTGATTSSTTISTESPTETVSSTVPVTPTVTSRTTITTINTGSAPSSTTSSSTTTRTTTYPVRGSSSSTSIPTESPKPVTPHTVSTESAISKTACFVPVLCGENNEPNWIQANTENHWTEACNKDIQELSRKLSNLRDVKFAELKKRINLLTTI